MSDQDIRIVEQLGSLAQPTRLAAFKALIRSGSEGLPAGQIANRLDVAPNTLSAHLAILQRAGLVSPRREGRSIIYTVVIENVAQLIDTLVNDCCDGHPDACASIVRPRERDVPEGGGSLA